MLEFIKNFLINLCLIVKPTKKTSKSLLEPIIYTPTQYIVYNPESDEIHVVYAWNIKYFLDNDHTYICEL